MNDERLQEKCTTASAIDTNKNQEVLELTLDELSYVAGGYFIKLSMD
jgi:hypothetical protein